MISFAETGQNQIKKMDEFARKGRGRQRRERAIRIFFFCIALASITTLGLIVVFLFMEGLPIFAKVSVNDFIFGRYWYPTDEPPDFGIFALIMRYYCSLCNFNPPRGVDRPLSCRGCLGTDKGIG
jgi:ABC-type phosphate transport system permease subunit